MIPSNGERAAMTIMKQSAMVEAQIKEVIRILKEEALVEALGDVRISATLTCAKQRIQYRLNNLS